MVEIKSGEEGWMMWAHYYAAKIYRGTITRLIKNSFILVYIYGQQKYYDSGVVASVVAFLSSQFGR